MEKYSKRFVFLHHALFVKAESGATNTKYLVENGIHVARKLLSPHEIFLYKGVFFSDFMFIFALSLMIIAYFKRST